MHELILWEIKCIVFPILQMRKVRPGKVKSLC